MAAVSKVDAVVSNQLEERLSNFRLKFESTRIELGVAASPNAVKNVFLTGSAYEAKNLALDLIIFLQNQADVHTLPSRENLRKDLYVVGYALCMNDLDTELALPLIELAVNNAPDAEIHDAVSKLAASIAGLNSRIPLTAVENAIPDTPVRSSSASQMGNEQTHCDIDQRITEELEGCVYYNGEGFYTRYFEDKDWSNEAKGIYEKFRTEHAADYWSKDPAPAAEVPFIKWFMNFQETVLHGSVKHKYYTSANQVLRGSEARRKLDIFLAPSNAALEDDGTHDWSNVLVIGEHKSNPDEDRAKSTMVQLAGYAREVFGSQPDRRFVPGFTICGSLMRLWVFDRSGSYNSRPFDIHKEPERFIGVTAGYALMTDAELGLNTFIKLDGNLKYILAQETKIFLEDKPIASTKAIVCSGTTCYRGKRVKSVNSTESDWEYVVKFAWPYEEREREGRLLKVARERGVTGIAEFFSYERITIDGEPDTISHLRRAINFEGKGRGKSSLKAQRVNNGTKSSQAKSLIGLPKSSMPKSSKRRFTTGLRISTSNISGQKRKTDEGFLTGRSEIKRSKSDDGQTEMTDHNTKGHESSTHIVHGVEEAEADGLVGNESGASGSRIHCCLVVSPAGRPLNRYNSVKEFLEVLRDAIAGHKSLLEDGKILHRDISENNIIITESASDGTPKGRLIDLDLAKELDDVPSGARHRTGTMQFMAIGVLQGKGHTYRHDLESFFYVFIWMCIRYGYDDLEKSAVPRSGSRKRRETPSKTSAWYAGDYETIADAKISHTAVFEPLTAEFSPEFCGLKDLAWELRSVLFPVHYNPHPKFFYRTYTDSSIMYEGMITAFNKAISHLEQGS